MAEVIFRQTLAAGTVVGGDMETRVEDQIIAEGVDGGDGTEFAVGEIEAATAEEIAALPGVSQKSARLILDFLKRDD